MICSSLHAAPLTYNTIYSIITHLQTLTIQKKATPSEHATSEFSQPRPSASVTDTHTHTHLQRID
jgi:hypothetical protein